MMKIWSGANVPCDELRLPADTQARRRLRSASSTSLDDRAFPVAAARLWNSLPAQVTAASCLSIFCCRLELSSLSSLLTFLFRFLTLLSFVQCPCNDSSSRHLGHYNRCYIYYICSRSAFVDILQWTQSNNCFKHICTVLNLIFLFVFWICSFSIELCMNYTGLNVPSQIGNYNFTSHFLFDTFR